jgi:hypothetical protein
VAAADCESDTSSLATVGGDAFLAAAISEAALLSSAISEKIFSYVRAGVVSASYPHIFITVRMNRLSLAKHNIFFVFFQLDLNGTTSLNIQFMHICLRPLILSILSILVGGGRCAVK